MTIEEKLSFFLDMINCNYELYHWDYDANINFIQTNWDKSLFANDILSILGLKKLVTTHMEQQLHTPLILEASNNLLWIAGFYYHNDQFTNLYLIGPILGGRDTQLLIRKKLDSYNLSVKLRSNIQKLFVEIPTIPSNVLFQYATMFHWCLNNEKITFHDVKHTTTTPTESNMQMSFSNHTGIWINEEKLCKMFEEGNPRYKEALLESQSLSHGVKMDLGDTMRSCKNNCIVLLTICSRACIRGGLNPSISYDLNDYYAKRIEECNSQSDTASLINEMLEDYVSRVREARNHFNISPFIQSSCDYIKQHVKEPLSIEELAYRTGYTEYYFSHKFKKEIGCSVKEFILKEKIEQVKFLLAGSNTNIQDLSDEFSFSNRSHFYSCFQKYAGMSPSEYRKKYHKF